MIRILKLTTAILSAVWLVLIPVFAAAQVAAEGPSDAAQANNPLADITAFNIQNYYIDEFTGPGTESGNQFVLRFAQPFELGDTNWLLRASLPYNSFPIGPGGSTNRIGMCSNGYIWLDGTTTTADYTPSSSELVVQQPRLAPCWVDLNPASGGSCHIDSLGSSVVVTWLNLPEYPNAGSNSMQRPACRSMSRALRES